MSDDRLTTRDIARSMETATTNPPSPPAQTADARALPMFSAERLTEVFADERTTLEHQWDQGDQISTEDLPNSARRV